MLVQLNHWKHNKRLCMKKTPQNTAGQCYHANLSRNRWHMTTIEAEIYFVCHNQCKREAERVRRKALSNFKWIKMMTKLRLEIVFEDTGSATIQKFLVVSIGVIIIGQAFQGEPKLYMRIRGAQNVRVYVQRFIKSKKRRHTACEILNL